MRLFLLPISTRRTLIYCERAPPSLPPGEKPPLTDRLINKASTTWAGWEQAEKGWQKQLTTQGNRFLRRIPYEEWGLKSIPPATKKRLEEVDAGKVDFECLFPGRFFGGGGGNGGVERATKVLGTLATEREGLHKRRMWNSIIFAPFTIPFALVPVIPNIPFFYLCYRAYSHYRALYGGKLLSHILTTNKLKITDSPVMDELYAAGLLHPHRDAARSVEKPTTEQVEQVAQIVQAQTQGGEKDVMVLQKWNGKLIAERFGLPEMEVEIERAVEQVEKAIEKETKVLEEEKKEATEAGIGEKAATGEKASMESAEAKTAAVQNPDTRR